MSNPISKAIQYLHHEESSIVEASLRILINIAFEDENQEIIREEGGIEPLTNFLTSTDEVRVMMSAWALSNIALNSKNQQVIGDYNIFRTIIELISNTENNDVLEKVLWLATNLSQNERNRRLFISNNILPTLKSLLTYFVSDQTKLQSISIFRNFLIDDSAKQWFVNEGGIRILENLFESPDERIHSQVSILIAELSTSEEYRTMIANTEILNYLWRSLKTAQTADTKLHAVWALTNLAIDSEIEKLICSKGIILTLVDLLSVSSLEIRQEITILLTNISLNPSIRVMIRDSGGLQIIKKLLDLHELPLLLETLKLITNLSIDENNGRLFRSLAIKEKVEMIANETNNSELKEAAQNVIDNLSSKGISTHRSLIRSHSPLRQSAAPLTPEQEKEIQKQLKQKDMHDEMNEFLNFSPNKPKRNRQIANRNITPSSSSLLNNNNNNEEDASSLSSSEGSHHRQQNVSGGQQFLQRRPSLTGEKRLNDFIQKPGRITQVLLVDTNTNEMHIRRSNIVHEMYDTENNYVTSLRILIEEYYHPLREMAKTQKPLISEQNVKSLFSHVELIYNINSQFCGELKHRINDWSESHLIGDLFLNLSKMLPMYSEYINNYGIAMELCSSLVVDTPAFKDFLDSKQFGDRCKGLPISALMITPIQRIPRYSLLLHDLLKNTPNDHVDYQNIENALNKIKSTADYLNEQKRNSENLLKVLTVHQTLEGHKDTLVVPGRIYMGEGSVLESNKSGSEYRYLFLFSDILIVTKQRKNKYRVKDMIYLTNLKLLNLHESEVLKNAFKLIFHHENDKKEQEITLYTTSVDEKERWVHLISDAIKTRKKNDFNFKKHQLASSTSLL